MRLMSGVRLQQLPELLFAPSDLLQNFLEQAPVEISWMHRNRRDDRSGDRALVVAMASPLVRDDEALPREHAINVVRCARRQPGEHHTAAGNSTTSPRETGADVRSTGTFSS